MTKKIIAIFFLTGFLVFSFSTTICLATKLNAQQVALLVGNMAEEEDETEKDTKSESDDFLDFNSIFSPVLLGEATSISRLGYLFIELVINKINTPPPQPLS